MNDDHVLGRMFLVGLCVLWMTLPGCALIRPDYRLQEDTPIDWGLAEAFEGGITVQPFEGAQAKWGLYAAEYMQTCLLEAGAFRRVVLSADDSVSTPLVLQGEIGQLYYGGTDTPSRANLTVRIVSMKDSQTRYLKHSGVAYERSGVHLTWFSRIFPPSPYPEELLRALVKRSAEDIARRTRQNGTKCP